MTTRFYLHAANSTVSGTLPSTEQSTLTATGTFDTPDPTFSINRNMDIIIGTSQTSQFKSSFAVTSLTNYYVTKWVSPVLNQTSVSANTWTLNFAYSESNTSANFIVSGSAQPIYINCYVWKPSNGTKYGTILDGNSASSYSETGSINTEVVGHGTFSGSAVSSLTSGDAVIVYEMWFRITQSMAQNYTDTIYYDGTTVNTTNGATVSNHASFLETPETLTLANAPIDMTNSSTLTFGNHNITKV